MDSDVLAQQTVTQLDDATYRTGRGPYYCTDANRLVPTALSDDNRDTTQRYPPHMSASFLVETDALDDAHLSIAGGFHQPGFLQYSEYRENYHGAITNSPDIDLPSGFTSVFVGGEDIEIGSEGTFEDVSTPPLGYELGATVPLADLAVGGDGWSNTAHVDGTDAVVKHYDEDRDRTETASFDADGAVMDPVALNGATDPPSARGAYVTLVRSSVTVTLQVTLEEAATYPDCHRVRVELVNLGGDTMPDRTLEQVGQSLLNPFLHISVDGTNPRVPAQQHADVFADAVDEPDSNRSDDRENIEPMYSATNGVLTQAVQDPNTLVVTTFGVYDYHPEEPISGPTIRELTAGIDELLAAADFDDDTEQLLRDRPRLLERLIGILEAVPKAFDLGDTPRLYRFQWAAIQRRLELIATDSVQTTVLKAPTNAGKTLPFMVNGVLEALSDEQRTVLAFPTRLLNQDMYNRLTRLVHALRETLDDDLTGGLLIGTSDPLYDSMTDPNLGEALPQYERCPRCDARGTIMAAEVDGRTVGECCDCGHQITYMYGPREATSYLPTLTIATPDKLFYELTVRGFASKEYSSMPFFGGTYLPCDCGAAVSYMNPPDWVDELTCPECDHDYKIEEIDDSDLETSTVGHFVFDEVHAVEGLSGIVLSVFLELMDIVESKIHGHDYLASDDLANPTYRTDTTFEAGTATIANEQELLAKITRTDPGDVEPLPADDERAAYFRFNEDRVRYRAVAAVPTATSTRQSVKESMIAYHRRHHDDPQFQTDLETAIDMTYSDASVGADAYSFVLGYVYRKQNGFALRQAIADATSEQLSARIEPPFLSGYTSSREMAEVFTKAQQGEVSMLLANLVISLGIDVKSLNSMIMYGAPRSMSEQAQTAGRTGRGTVPGHVLMHLEPSRPRDMFLFENFHRVMGDLKDMYRSSPIESTNAYVAKLVTPNLVKALLNAHSYDEYALKSWSAAEVLGRDSVQATFIKDLMLALTTSETTHGLRREIHNIVSQRLNTYLRDWSQREDSVYLSEWFGEEVNQLTSIRATGSKDVTLEAAEGDLLKDVQRDQNSNFSSS